ncbi:MAG: hypothetical protein E6H90_09925 [Chloroflexi bacterium]|nr:MAG: hypothetical protein E6H90_09925 [Chloroflexota bacterium]
MIVCKQCGHHNEDSDTFCGSCGKFLEWTGERVIVAQPEPEPAPAPEPEPEPARVGFMDRVKQAVGMEDEAPPPPATTVEAPAAPPPLTAVAIAAAPSLNATAAPVAAPEPVLAGVGAPAAPAAVPVGSVDEPVSRRPTSLAPVVTRPRPGPRTMEPPTRRNPGDLICGQCGEGNDPARHFCRRCGNSLDEAIAVRLPWYRRFFNRLFVVRTREAGWRPRRVGPPNVMGGVMRVVRLAIVAMLAVGILGFLLIPPFHNWVVNKVTAGVTSVRKVVHPNYDTVYPVAAAATSQTAGHAASLTIDRTSNSYWAAISTDKTPQLVFTFSEPQDLSEILFRSGAPGAQPSDFLNQPRPKAVHIIFTDAQGKLITATDITLTDQEGSQFYPIEAKQTTTARIQIQSVYPATGAARSAVAIAEVEFKIKD